MEIRKISKDEIMHFFESHSGYFTVMRLGELLIPQNAQDEEIKLIKNSLHELKTEDHLLIKKEGEDWYHEEFSSTPDRIKKYFDEKISGRVIKGYKIFYSWQSDLPNSVARGLIGNALEKVAKEVGVVTPIIIDRDTKGELGAPDIPSTIFKKIEASDVVVADVSIVGKYPGRKGRNGKRVSKFTPNPNVLFELGYAFKAKGHERILLVFNDAYGKVESLPFDLRSRKPIIYHFKEGDGGTQNDVKKNLVRELGDSIRALLVTKPTAENNRAERPMIDIKDNFVVSSGSDGCYIRVKAINIGKEPAHDLKCRLESGDGKCFSAEKKIASLLVPSGVAPAIDYKYSDSDFFNRLIDRPRIIFNYKDIDGNSYVSGRNIVQKQRDDKRYNIDGEYGDFFKN
jgi:hypothetical protein